MRILVVSDTHGDRQTLHRVILSQPRAEVVIHLGDGCEDIEEERFLHPEKMFLQVRGNCDWGSLLPAVGELCLEGRHIFYTHGHLYEVKYGLSNLVAAAEERGAQIALFGHTHQAMTEYRGGLYLMNPGSLSGPSGTYGIIDLTPAGIVTNILHL